MFDFTNLFIGTAFAQGADAAATTNTIAATGNALMQFLPLFLIFGVFYFLIIRPQQKKLDDQTAMLKALKKGDRVTTGGGIIGTIVKADEDYLTVEIAEGVQVKVARMTIHGLAVEDKNSAKK